MRHIALLFSLLLMVPVQAQDLPKSDPGKPSPFTDADQSPPVEIPPETEEDEFKPEYWEPPSMPDNGWEKPKKRKERKTEEDTDDWVDEVEPPPPSKFADKKYGPEVYPDSEFLRQYERRPRRRRPRRYRHRHSFDDVIDDIESVLGIVDRFIPLK